MSDGRNPYGWQDWLVIGGIAAALAAWAGVIIYGVFG